MEIAEQETEESIENRKNEIASYLESSDYSVHEYPNGLVMGLRLRSIPGSKGVHVDVVHVLDLREAKFGRTALAVQSALLDTIDKDLRHLLDDVGLGSMFEIQEAMTPFGRAHLRVLRASKGSRGSMIYETRSVYLVHSGSRVPPSNVMWLAKPARIVRAGEFSLLHQSDARSSLHDVKTSIEQDKWSDLEAGYRAGWWSILPLVFLMASAVGIGASLLTSSGSLFLPVATAAICAPLFAWLARNGASRLDSFNEALDTEEAKLEKAGDLAHIRREIQKNEERLGVVGKLRFVVTPLMGGAGVAVESGDFASAASSLSAILTECVMHSPRMEGEEESAGDLGLKKFIELYHHLGVDLDENEEMALGLAYAAIIGHPSAPLSNPEILHHMGVLNNSLFDCGILTADVKSTIDDMMNFRSMGDLAEKWDEGESDTPKKPEDEPSEGPSGIDDKSLVEMSDASLRPVGYEEEKPESDDKETVLTAETVQTKLDEEPVDEKAEGESAETAEAVVSKHTRTGSTSKAKKKEREAIEA